MIYQLQLSPEHLDLAVRAIGALPYADVNMLMDVIRIQVHAQNEVHLKRMQSLAQDRSL
jgi:hypothetical protein